METVLHQVKKIGLSKINKCLDGYHQDIIIMTDRNEILKLNLFSDTKEGLKTNRFENLIDFKYPKK
jgi:hypothetical protein